LYINDEVIHLESTLDLYEILNIIYEIYDSSS